ncbi:MAG TPA: GNAT family N-acetyltransferase [Sporosarcina sp.]|nr:GNAT family N-acetyltransferase [Sporosarcina sp.]
MKTIQLKNGEHLSIHQLLANDLPIIMQLQEEVIQSLDDKRSLQPLSEEEFMTILNGNGLMIGAFHHERLIAFRAMLYPKVDEAEHLAADAGIPQHEWSLVSYSEISTVHPSYRGQSLQKKMGYILFELVDQHMYRYVCATVAPFNIPSLLDKFAQQMYIVALKEKYNGLLRYILCRDFTFSGENGEEQCVVRMDHIIQQQQLLDEGWRGVGIYEEQGQWYVRYCK